MNVLFNHIVAITSQYICASNHQIVHHKHIVYQLYLKKSTKKIFFKNSMINSCQFNSVFSSGSNGKESACSAGDPGLSPGSGSSPGEGNDNPLQYSCQGNSMDRGAWWSTVHGVTKELDMT